jgi:hypothetical protein
MKTFLTLLLSAGILLIGFPGKAQIIPGAVTYHEQALMFSNYDYTGSARIHAIGNTQVSLGGDISSALSNPAGLGFYNRSEISITPTVNIFEAGSNYLNQNTSTSTTKFNIDNIGIVFNKIKNDYEPGKWRGGSFAISLSKINEFNTETNYAGSNGNNDIIDYYVQDANQQNVDPGELPGATRGAYESYLISEFLDASVDGTDTTYFPFYERTFFGEFPSQDFPTNQSETIMTSGSQNQWNFSYGGNYGDVLYFGLTLGVQTLKYDITKTYSEQYPSATNLVVDASLLTENLLTEGIGVNGTFGLIARPINQMTIGFSLITPTYLSISERYQLYTEARFNQFDMNNYGDYFDANYEIIENPNADFTTFYESTAFLETRSFSDDESFFDYTLTTPLRLNGGITYFLNKNGFISADIEFVDYSNMKLDGKGGSLEADNNDIKAFYKSTINYSVGAEWRLNKVRFRAGYNVKGNPYNSDEIDLSAQTFSGGIGYRSSKFSLDFASSYRQYNTQYAPYNLENPDNNPVFETSVVDIDNSNLNLVLTFGLFF